MSRLSSQRTACLLFWAPVVLYLGLRADRGWIPHDEGTLGHTAERVLAGELPHRDFDDTYTGGLAMLHAAAFRLFGVELAVLRWTLLAFTAAFVAAFYSIAARLAGPWAAGAVTWLAVAWSLPIYFAGMPSWYNLFFATFGTLALLKHLESGGRRWLFAAGLCGGVSFLMKSVGLLFVAAALLFLVYREQQQALEAGDGAEDAERLGPGAFRLATGVALVAFCGLLLGLVPWRPMELVCFAAPGCAIALFLLRRGRRLPGGEGRWQRLLGLASPFLAGVAAPVAIFLVPYAASGSLTELFSGVFVLPLKRLGLAAQPLPPALTLAAALPVAGLLFLAGDLRRGIERTLTVAVIAAAVLGVAVGDREVVYRAVWYSVRPLAPLAALAALLLLVRRGESLDPLRSQQLMLLLATASLWSLVQHPYAYGVYFAFTAPSAALLILAVVRCRAAADGRRGHPLAAVVLGFYLVFAVLWLHRGWVQAMGIRYWPIAYDAPLAVDRGGLRVQGDLARTYERLVSEVRQRSPAGSFIYATPDCPEVYFLTGRRNPTRTLADFFEDDYFEPERRAERLLALLAERRIDVVVFNRAPHFSDLVPRALVAGVLAGYPHRIDLPPFSIHWRSPGDSG